PEFQDLATDTEFAGLRQRGASIAEVLNYPKVQGILNNADLLKSIETSLVPNLKDLRTFLETGESAVFREKVLGRWRFDVNGTLGLLRREKPNITSKEISQRRGVLAMVADKAMIIVTPEQQVLFKSVPFVKAGTVAPRVQDVQGEWKGTAGKYTITVPVDGRSEQLSAELNGSRLILTGADLMGLAFARED
ncbi:MAG: hypothetical protein H7Y43_11940, partial [Akkermansiaceae bacterium]|nr:hypothetical protein [Verrucomicrobiales bacterium]